MLFNDELDYAVSRLNNSFVKSSDYDIGIIRVAGFDNPSRNNKLSSSILVGRDKNLKEVRVDPASISFAVGKLGYVNGVFNSARYLARMPLRRDYKQGLRSSQLVSMVSLNKQEAVREDHFNNADFLRSVTDCLFSKYPGFNGALDRLEETGAIAAISRHFAIDDAGKLHYKAERVGYLTGDNRVKFNTKFNFLEQEFAAEVGDGYLARL